METSILSINSENNEYTKLLDNIITIKYNSAENIGQMYFFFCNDKAKHIEIANELSAIAKKSRKYGYVFDSAAKLSSFLAVKYELGVKTRKAYKSGDIEGLRALALNDYTKAEKLLRQYISVFEKQWMKENKPQGFDAHENRLGGILLRTESCKKRLLDYTSGKLDRIDELEEELLPFGRKEHTMLYNGRFTPNWQ